MSSNPGRVKLEVPSTSALSRTLTKNINWWKLEACCLSLTISVRHTFAIGWYIQDDGYEKSGSVGTWSNLKKVMEIKWVNYPNIVNDTRSTALLPYEKLYILIGNEFYLHPVIFYMTTVWRKWNSFCWAKCFSASYVFFIFDGQAPAKNHVYWLMPLYQKPKATKFIMLS